MNHKETFDLNYGMVAWPADTQTTPKEPEPVSRETPVFDMRGATESDLPPIDSPAFPKFNMPIEISKATLDPSHFVMDQSELESVETTDWAGEIVDEIYKAKDRNESVECILAGDEAYKSILSYGYSTGMVDTNKGVEFMGFPVHRRLDIAEFKLIVSPTLTPEHVIQDASLREIKKRLYDDIEKSMFIRFGE